MLYPNEAVIHEANAHEFQAYHDGAEAKGKGLVPRPFETHPPGCYAAGATAIDLPLIPQSEWSARIKAMEDSKSRISDMRMVGNKGQMIPSLDQNGKGFCWAHSSTSATMMLRCVQNQPYVGLSAFAVACIIKNYRDEGGWGAQSMDFICQKGVPSAQFWPMQSMSQGNDKPETWANAAKHKVTEGFWDSSAQQYDRNLTFEQVVTLLLCRVPVVVDYNWWSHSVCAIDAVDGASQFGAYRGESGKLPQLHEFEEVWGMNDPVTAGTSVRILNSWGDSWSDHGMGVLTGQKAVPDGAVAPRVTGASPELR
jgi:hypothetical protein